MVTPFGADGEVDLGRFGEMTEYQIQGGVSALVVLGTTGEPATMSEDEKSKLIKYAVERAAGRVKIIVGVGSNDTKKAAFQARRAEELGADGVLAVTPYYNKCTQDGLILYYRAICEATRLPVIVYNVPGRTGVNLLPATMARIAELPTVAGIKEASGNMAQVMETMRLIRGKCDLYSGEDALNVPILAVGGTAVISVVSNLLPAEVSMLAEAVLARKLYTANALSDRLAPLVKACFTEVNPIPVKAAMKLIGLDAGDPRPPLTPLSEEKLGMLREALSIARGEATR